MPLCKLNSVLTTTDLSVQNQRHWLSSASKDRRITPICNSHSQSSLKPRRFPNKLHSVTHCLVSLPLPKAAPCPVTWFGDWHGPYLKSQQPSQGMTLNVHDVLEEKKHHRPHRDKSQRNNVPRCSDIFLGIISWQLPPAPCAEGYFRGKVCATCSQPWLNTFLLLLLLLFLFVGLKCVFVVC